MTYEHFIDTIDIGYILDKMCVDVGVDILKATQTTQTQYFGSLLPPYNSQQINMYVFEINIVFMK